jgi:hypothetical protein
VDWAADPTNSIAALNIADGLWTEIPLLEGRTRIFIKSLREGASGAAEI